MNPSHLIACLIETGLALALSVLVPYLAFRIFPWFTGGIDETAELKLNNHAVGILLGSLVISTGIVVFQALNPACGGFRNTFFLGLNLRSMLQSTGFALAYVLVVTIISILAVWISIRLFMILTHDLDELEEIRKGNVSVAICLACVLLVVSTFLGYGARTIVESFPITW